MEATIFSFLWGNMPNTSTDNKKALAESYINDILRKSDWTQLPDSGLALSEQIAQQEIRAEWAGLDLSDPDNVVLPEMPLVERP